MQRGIRQPKIDRNSPLPVETQTEREALQAEPHNLPPLEYQNNPSNHNRGRRTWQETELELDYSPDDWLNNIKVGFIGVVLAVYHTTRGILSAHRNRIWWLTTIYYTWTALCGAQYLLIEQVQPAFLCKPPISMVTRAAYCPKPDTFSPDFRQLVSLQYKLQDAMERSTGALIIAVGVKRSELAVRDLVVLVEESSLVARDSLTKNLNQFANDAKAAGRSLQRFGGRVGGAVDQVVAMNEYAVELLGRVAGGQGGSFIGSLAPQDPVTRTQVTKEVWFEAVKLLKSEVGTLIEEASINMHALDRLENDLSVIHTMAVRENKAVAKDKNDALSGLWTELFGTNQTQVAQFDEHAQLLKDIIKYREDAVYHVAGTLMQLQQLEIGLENLNQEVTRALFRQKVVEIPLGIHIKAIQKGTERLIEAQRRAREREDDFMRSMLNKGQR